MPGYDVTPVNIPGVLGAYEAGRTNRIHQMLYQQQLQAAERQADRQSKFDGILAGAFARPAPAAASSSGSSGSTASPAPQGGVMGAYEGMSPPTAAAAPAATPLDHPTAAPGVGGAPAVQTGLSPEVMQQLAIIDPEQATQLAAALRGMNDLQHQQTERTNQTLGREAAYMRTLPLGVRMQELAGAAQRLIQAGVSQEMIAPYISGQTQLDDAHLDSMIAQARDIEKIIEDTRPRLRNVQAGDTVIDERNPSGPPVYESPYVRGPDGSMYNRPPSMRAPPAVGEVREGHRFRGGNPADPNSWEAIEGGAAQPEASGNFPRQDGGAFDLSAPGG